MVATELGLELARRGHDIHFITYSQPVRLSQLSPNVHYHEVNVPEYPLFHYQPYELALSSKLVDMVKLYDIELMHVHYAIPHAYAGYMAKQMLRAEGIYIPMVTTLHGTDITLVGNHPFYKPAVAFSINQSDVVTSVSESLKADTYRHFPISKDIHVIPNFIELDQNTADPSIECRRSLIAEDSERIITHISNFRKVKRLEDVVRIFHGIGQKIPSKLLMVGDGPDRAKAEALARQLGIEDRIIFFGNSNEIAQILSLTDLFLLPSETESFGLAALEAMVWGIPVISSDSGGLPEVNIHGKTGFLSPVGDVASMAAHGIYILENEERYAEFRKNAREVAKTFDIAKILPKYEALYQQAIALYYEKNRSTL